MSNDNRVYDHSNLDVPNFVNRSRSNSINTNGNIPKQKPTKVAMSKEKLEKIKEKQFVKGFVAGITGVVLSVALFTGALNAWDKETQIRDQQVRSYYEDLGIDFDEMVQRDAEILDSVQKGGK